MLTGRAIVKFCLNVEVCRLAGTLLVAAGFEIGQGLIYGPVRARLGKIRALHQHSELEWRSKFRAVGGGLERTSPSLSECALCGGIQLYEYLYWLHVRTNAKS